MNAITQRVFLAAFGLCLAAATPALANGGGYITGLESTGAFKPIGLQQVEMVSERLEIDLHLEYAEVRIHYVLHNPGPKVDVEAGFPSAVNFDSPPTGPDGPGLSKHALTKAATLEDFSLSADGHPLKATVKPDDLNLKEAQEKSMFGDIVVKAWHIFQLPFAHDQTREVDVSYRNPYSAIFTWVSDNEHVDPLTMTYLFSSAAAWKGPIHEGVVTVRAVSANPEWVTFNHPNRFHREGRTWTWKFTDFKPTLEDDLVITTRPSYFSQPTMTDLDDTAKTIHDFYVGWGAQHREGGRENATWELRRYDYIVRASSTLAPDGDIHYDAANLKGYTGTGSAWVEGVKGPGIGEYLTFTLPTPSKIHRVGIVNGYTKSKDLYYANNRVAEFQVSVNGEAPVNVSVPDEMLHHEMFYFDLPVSKELVKSVRLTIAKVYKGTRHDDTCISRVTLITPLSKEPKIRPVR